MNEYCVYMHTCPDGKRYIGMTKNINDRWKYNGSGYIGQYFANAIYKFGWDNISHEVLYTSLSIDDAKRIESELIQRFDTISNGYNVSSGEKLNEHNNGCCDIDNNNFRLLFLKKELRYLNNKICDIQCISQKYHEFYGMMLSLINTETDKIIEILEAVYIKHPELCGSHDIVWCRNVCIEIYTYIIVLQQSIMGVNDDELFVPNYYDFNVFDNNAAFKTCDDIENHFKHFLSTV